MGQLVGRVQPYHAHPSGPGYCEIEKKAGTTPTTPIYLHKTLSSFKKMLKIDSSLHFWQNMQQKQV